MSGAEKQKLLRLLARQELSTASAIKKLRDRDVSLEVAKQVVAECVASGYIDDRRWAEGRVRFLLRKKKGNGYIRQKLAQEGLSGELIEEALPSQESQIDAFQRLMATRYAKRDLTDHKERQKTIQALQRQGFPLSLILNCPEISSIG